MFTVHGIQPCYSCNPKELATASLISNVEWIYSVSTLRISQGPPSFPPPFTHPGARLSVGDGARRALIGAARSSPSMAFWSREQAYDAEDLTWPRQGLAGFVVSWIVRLCTADLGRVMALRPSPSHTVGL